MGNITIGKITYANYEYFHTTLMEVRSPNGTYYANFSAPYIKDRPSVENEQS